jgi:hypothetical protein
MLHGFPHSRTPCRVTGSPAPRGCAANNNTEPSCSVTDAQLKLRDAFRCLATRFETAISSAPQEEACAAGVRRASRQDR